VAGKFRGQRGKKEREKGGEGKGVSVEQDFLSAHVNFFRAGGEKKKKPGGKKREGRKKEKRRFSDNRR